jgi:tRNA (guanine-N7-)-methyltransferase
LDLEQVFGRVAPVVMDIGFGGGEGLIDMAGARADECIIGIEIHTPGVAKVLDAIEAGPWNHVRLVEGDALDFLPRVPLGSLSGVRIWFPDPWLKNKQQHRRLVRPQVVAALTDRLRVGGVLHVATDIAEYARHTEKVIAGEDRLRGGAIERPEWRPVTRFERRGLAAGRASTDLWYERLS